MRSQVRMPGAAAVPALLPSGFLRAAWGQVAGPCGFLGVGQISVDKLGRQEADGKQVLACRR